MAIFNLHYFVLSVLSILSLCRTQNNTKVQLDLLFPRSNAVYKPVYPFPIVFIVHNAALSWPFGTQFSWQLDENGTVEHPKYQLPWKGIDTGGYYPTQTLFNPTQGRGAPPPSPFLFINSSLNIINTTSTMFRLRYRFGLWSNCSDQQAESDMNSTKAYRSITVIGEVFFNISKDNGKVPSIEVGEYATPLGAIGILGTNGSEYGFPCPIRQDPPPETDEYLFKADYSVAKEVAHAMVGRSECRNQSWPNVTGLLGPCIGKGSTRFVSLSGPAMEASLGKLVIFAGILGFTVLVAMTGV
jgi:hypothetical protein